MAPDGSKPLSYPLLVQPVLDAHCIRCHSGEKPPKGIVLTRANLAAYQRGGGFGHTAGQARFEQGANLFRADPGNGFAPEGQEAP